VKDEVALDDTPAFVTERIDGLLAVFDLTDLESTTHFTYWLERSSLRKSVPCVLLANRADERDAREVTVEKVKAFGDKLGIETFEVSAKSGANCLLALECLLTELRAVRPHYRFDGHSSLKILQIFLGD